jgi:hypothetical protein
MFLITIFFLLYDQFLSFIKIIVGAAHTVSLPFASFVGAGHFFLNGFLECVVKFLTMLPATNVNFFGQLVEGLETIF